MKNPINSKDQERVLGVLHSRGWVSSEDLMAVLGKSQPTVSRVLASLSGRVLAFGNARARRYGLPRLIRGRPARQPVWWTDEQGRTHELAMLTLLVGSMLCIESVRGCAGWQSRWSGGWRALSQRYPTGTAVTLADSGMSRATRHSTAPGPMRLPSLSSTENCRPAC